MEAKMLDIYIPGNCLPGLMLAWHEWMGTNERDRPMPYPLLDTRIPAHRDFISRVLAEVLGVLVGATAPEFQFWPEGRWDLARAIAFEGYPFPPDIDWYRRVPSLASIPLDHPDRDPLALAMIARWVGEEVKAGRIQVKR
jgi:hypothetical protein